MLVFSCEKHPWEDLVNDIAASEDILGEIILYKTLLGNIFVYFIMSALYFYNIIF